MHPDPFQMVQMRHKFTLCDICIRLLGSCNSRHSIDCRGLTGPKNHAFLLVKVTGKDAEFVGKLHVNKCIIPFRLHAESVSKRLTSLPDSRVKGIDSKQTAFCVHVILLIPPPTQLIQAVILLTSKVTITDQTQNEHILPFWN